MSSTAQLRDLQRQFANGVMRSLLRDDRTRKRWHDGRPTQIVVDQLIRPNSRMTSLERYEIYNRQYWFRLWDCLWDDFSGVRTILGKRRFFALATAYLQRHPSRSFTLRNLGHRLAYFMADDLRWRKGLSGPLAQFAQEVAQIEWAQIIAFDGPELPPLVAESLHGLSPENLRLRIQPHITLLRLHFSLDAFLDAIKKEKRAAMPERRPLHLAVYRLKDVVHFKELSAAQYRLLIALQAGHPLNYAITRAGKIKDPAELGRWFALWSSLGWFCTDSSNAIAIQRGDLS